MAQGRYPGRYNARPFIRGLRLLKQFLQVVLSLYLALACSLASAASVVFLNPGLEACLAHNRARPWEPHKYASKQAQDAMLANLQDWVAGYYHRADAWSYAGHRRIFDMHAGPKVELVSAPP